MDKNTSQTAEKAAKIIKTALGERGLKPEEIILFGSRARSDAKPDSDWDFLIIIGIKPEFRALLSVTDQVKRKLTEAGISNDVILKAREEFEFNSKYCGNVSYYAAHEGIRI